MRFSGIGQTQTLQPSKKGRGEKCAFCWHAQALVGYVTLHVKMQAVLGRNAKKGKHVQL